MLGLALARGQLDDVFLLVEHVGIIGTPATTAQSACHYLSPFHTGQEETFLLLDHARLFGTPANAEHCADHLFLSAFQWTMYSYSSSAYGSWCTCANNESCLLHTHLNDNCLLVDYIKIKYVPASIDLSICHLRSGHTQSGIA